MVKWYDLNSPDEREENMKYRPLGETGMQVPLIGLGTMTWGQQNNLQQACEQMDYALARGVNLFDVAECTLCRRALKRRARPSAVLAHGYVRVASAVT